MDHQQQPRSTSCSQFKQHHPQQRTSAQVETALHSRRFRFDCRPQLFVTHARIIEHRHRHRFVSVKARDLLTPTFFIAPEAQTKRIMLSQQRRHQLSQ